jgi:PST family polysaccharide transporter
MKIVNSLKNLNLNPDGKIIFKNFSYLWLLRIFNILSQYILVSFLIRNLGSEKYGIFVWAYSIIQYLVIVVNFGFNTFAAKYVPENLNKKDNLNKIFTTIIGFKLLLYFISATLFIILSLNIEVFADNSILFLILLGIGFGEAIFPIWFFQGKEKLEIPTKIVFLFRLILVISTLLFISNEYHLIRYAYFLTGTNILIGMSGLMIALNKLNIRFVKVKLSYIVNIINEAFIFFIGAIFGKSFNFVAIFLIGLYFTMEEVASFDIAFKIIAAIQLPFETLSVALFPTIARTKNIKLNEKIIFGSFIISLLLWWLTYWQSDFLISLLGGKELINYSYLLKKLSVLIPVVYNLLISNSYFMEIRFVNF